jgi:hypothetical protein
MRIEVTAEDIVKGKRMDCGLCPVALAIKRATGTAFSVGYMTCCPAGGTVRDRLELPAEARAFVHDFDCHMQTAPFAFDLDIPDAAKRTDRIPVEATRRELVAGLNEIDETA